MDEVNSPLPYFHPYITIHFSSIIVFKKFIYILITVSLGLGFGLFLFILVFVHIENSLIVIFLVHIIFWTNSPSNWHLLHQKIMKKYFHGWNASLLDICNKKVNHFMNPLHIHKTIKYWHGVFLETMTQLHPSWYLINSTQIIFINTLLFSIALTCCAPLLKH